MIKKNVYSIGLHVKYPLFLSDFNETWLFSTDIRKIRKYQISWESAQWEPSRPMQTGGQTDRYDKANNRIHNFANAPQKQDQNFAVRVARPHRQVGRDSVVGIATL